MQEDDKLLFVFRHAPYGASLAKAGLDAALAAAAFERPLCLLFYGQGVLQLMEGHQGKLLGLKDIRKQLNALPLYDVETIYADQNACECYGIDLGNSRPAIELVSHKDARLMMCHSRHVLSF